MKEWTTAEVAETLGVDKPIAYGLIQFLLAKGLAQEAGSRREPKQKGKGQLLYTFKKSIALLGQELQVLAVGLELKP